MSIERKKVCLGLTLIGLAMAPGVASAQMGGGSRHGGHHDAPATAPAPASAPKLAPEPVQRLDAGAMLCKTEEALQQHQAAVLARLNGDEGHEPTGACRIVQSRLAVAVLERHGPSHTEVRVPGPPEQVGWTDAMVRNQ